MVGQLRQAQAASVRAVSHNFQPGAGRCRTDTDISPVAQHKRVAGGNNGAVTNGGGVVQGFCAVGQQHIGLVAPILLPRVEPDTDVIVGVDRSRPGFITDNGVVRPRRDIAPGVDPKERIALPEGILIPGLIPHEGIGIGNGVVAEVGIFCPIWEEKPALLSTNILPDTVLLKPAESPSIMLLGPVWLK